MRKWKGRGKKKRRVIVLPHCYPYHHRRCPSFRDDLRIVLGIVGLGWSIWR